MPHTKEKKRVLLIGTGGTIASEVTDGGLAPELTTEQLLNHVPGISEICAVDCLQLLNLDSTNIGPAHWLQMARCLRSTMAAMTASSSPTARTPWPTRRRP